MNQVERSFAKLKGKPCWGVDRGFETFLTLEFGAPRLTIREPISLVRSGSRRVREHLARRMVHVRGRWHLLIYCCEWVVRVKGRVIGDSKTKKRADRAARELNGQQLVSVTTQKRGARTRFLFDLGAELETKPYDRSSEQWFLFEPNGRVLTLRADRTYEYGRADRSKTKSQWRRLAG